jgi:protein-S-isoprenylcysteine O-methyltransferase Ste14
MSSDPRREEFQGAEVPIPPPAVYLAAVVLGVLLHWLWALELGRGSSLRIALGVTLICGGVALLMGAFSIFRRIGQHPDPRKPTPAIARDGPYRFTRNPMYLGLSLIQLGLGIALSNAWIVLLLVPVVLLATSTPASRRPSGAGSDPSQSADAAAREESVQPANS